MKLMSEIRTGKRARGRAGMAFASVLGGAVLALSGCATDGPAPAGTDGSASGDGDLTTVMISMQRAIEPAVIMAGVEQDFFADRGIDLQLAPADLGGPAAVPSLINGDIQLSIGSAFGYLVAVDAGQPLQFVAPLAYGMTAEGEESSGLVVRDDSGIESLQDLEGATIAVAAINGLQSAAIDLAIAQETDLEPGDYSMVELPVPNLAQAVLDGQVDAAYLFEPTLTASQSEGIRLLAQPIVDVWGGETMTLAVYGAQDWVAENGEVVDAFQEALAASFDWANSNRDEFVEFAAGFTEIDADVVGGSRIPEFKIESEVDQFSAFAQDLVDLGTITSVPESSFLTAP